MSTGRLGRLVGWAWSSRASWNWTGSVAWWPRLDRLGWSRWSSGPAAWLVVVVVVVWRRLGGRGGRRVRVWWHRNGRVLGRAAGRPGHDRGAHECSAGNCDERAGTCAVTARRHQAADGDRPAAGVFADTALPRCCYGAGAHRSRAIRPTASWFSAQRSHKYAQDPPSTGPTPCRRGPRPRHGVCDAAYSAASTSSAELTLSPAPGSTASHVTTPSSMMAA